MKSLNSYKYFRKGLNVFQFILQGPPRKSHCQILKSENPTNVTFVAESFLNPTVLESIKKEKAFALLKWLSNVTERLSKSANMSILHLCCHVAFRISNKRWKWQNVLLLFSSILFHIRYFIGWPRLWSKQQLGLRDWAS